MDDVNSQHLVSFNFSSTGIPFVGREKELAFLVQNYRLASNVAGPEVVFVSGEEGVGKTALVNEFKGHIDGYFVSGCFSRFSPGEPYHALISVFASLCDLLIANDEVLGVRQHLKKSLRGETAVLSSWLPDLNKILGSSDGPTLSPDVHNWDCNDEWAFGRLKYSLRAFLKCACSPVRPVVIFLDNMDCADEESLDIISNILMDQQVDGLLFIGANRQVSDDHRLNHTIDRIKKENNGVSRLMINRLSSSMVSRIITCVTTRSADVGVEITKSISGEPAGNPFYLIEALKRTQQNNSINLDEGRIRTGSIEHFSTTAKYMLRVASQLGNTFSVSSLMAITSSASDTGEAWEELLRFEFIQESSTHPGWYEFSHQIYKEMLVRSFTEKTPSFHLQIGRVMQRLLLVNNETMRPIDSLLVVHHLNLASTLLDQVEMEDLARMNLKTAKDSIKKCALRSALKYLQYGLDLLATKEKWIINYSLNLELSTLFAKVSYSLGMLEECRVMIHDILANTQDIIHKIPAFVVLLETFGAQRRVMEGLEVGVGILNELGENISCSPGYLILRRESLRVKAMLRGKSDEDLIRTPQTTNKVVLAIARIASYVSMFAYQSAMPEVKRLLCLRMICMTIKEGINPYSPYSFASYGLSCSWSGDFKGGFRFGSLAEKMLELGGMDGCSARTRTINQSFLACLRKPHVESLMPLRLAWRTGLETADLHFAQFASNAFLVLSFFTGQPLPSILENWAIFRSDSSTYKQQLARQAVVPYYQATLNLTSGTCRDPVCLTGRAMNEEVSLEFATAHNDAMSIGAVLLAKLSLSCYFGDWKKAGEISDKICDHPRKHPYVCPLLFFLVLTSIKLHECQTHQRRSRHLMQELELWERRGAGSICTHFLLLLKAEQAAKKAKKGEFGTTQKLYDNAIEASLNGKFLNIAALGCELAGDFFKVRNNESLSSFYFRQAFALYDEWGAVTKCERLKDENGALLGAVTGPNPGGNFSHCTQLAPNARLVCLGGDIYRLEQQTNSMEF